MGRAYGANGDAGVRVIFGAATRYFAFMGLMLAGIGAFWSEPIIALFYGAGFESVAPVLTTFQIVGGLTITEAAFGSLLATTGQQAAWAKASCIGIPLSLVGSVLLVPTYGLQGAVISAVCSRVLTFAAVVFTVVRLRSVEPPTGPLAKQLLSAVLCAAGAYPLTLLGAPFGPWLAGGAFVLMLPIVTLLMRAWNRSDLELARALLTRIPAGAQLDRLAVRLAPFFAPG
jgi:O-antigen/teichoic acid export membrane protein